MKTVKQKQLNRKADSLLLTSVLSKKKHSSKNNKGILIDKSDNNLSPTFYDEPRNRLPYRFRNYG